MMRRPLRRGGRELLMPPLVSLVTFLVLSSSFFPKAAQAREQQQGRTEGTTSTPPQHSVVRLRSLEVGPASGGGRAGRSSSKRLFPFPRLLLEEESALGVPAPPLPDPRDERWGPLSRGSQAIVSFGGKSPSSSAASEPSPSSSPFSSSALSLSPSAAAVAAIERVGGTVSDSLPDGALLAVGLTAEALDELEKDQGTVFLFGNLFFFDRKRSVSERRRKEKKTAALTSLSLSFSLSYSCPPRRRTQRSPGSQPTSPK